MLIPAAGGTQNLFCDPLLSLKVHLVIKKKIGLETVGVIFTTTGEEFPVKMA